MEPYSTDLRQRVLEDSDAGMRTRQVARKYRVCESWVRRVKQRRREHGETAPRASYNPQKPVLDDHHQTLRAMVEREPDATLEEYCERLSAAHGVRVSVSTMDRALRELKLTRKKRRSTPPSRIGRT